MFGNMKTRIGRYEIQGELGRGGFGQVYRAFDPQVGRMVAVKVLTAEGDADLLTRFRNEAAAAGKLRHRNIVTIFDFGEQERTAYIVMELLDGEDLQRVIAGRTAMTLLAKVEIMSQIAEGLHHAHSHGIVHRDVKPANIMLLADRTVKIMDFGIALLAQTVTSRLTPQGNIIGTLNYMAPEQFQGLPADALGDIFAYGILSYELLTGRHPFQAPAPQAVMYNIVNANPQPFHDLCPEAPANLEHIVARALRKDRDLRYQSFEDLKFDIEPILLDLKREHSAGLLAEAQALTAEEQLDTAQKLIREILEIDPGNTMAWELREKIHARLQRRTVRPRVKQLVEAGQQELAARRFPEAIQNFESALRLDRSDTQIQDLIERTRTIQQQSRRAERLLSEARQALEVRNLTGAQKIASEAREIDPQNAEVGPLLERICQQIESREHTRRLREGLSRAKGKLLLQAFDEAIAILVELETENAGSAEISELLARAQAEKTSQQRKRLLEAELKSAKELIARREFAESIERLESARREFPNTTEVAGLLSYAQEELRAQQQAESVERITRDARTLIESRQFDRTVALLEQGLASYPGDNQLIRLMESTTAGRASFEREQALADASGVAARLHQAGSYAEAIQRIDAFVAEHGSDPGLAELQSRINADWEHRKRQETLREVLAQANDLLNAGRAATAIQILRRACDQLPNEPTLLPLLTLAQAKLREQQRAESVAKVARQAADLTATAMFDQALEVLDQGIKSFPRERVLFRSREAALAAKVSHEKQAEADAIVRRATKLLEEKYFDRAVQEVETALLRIGDNPALQNLKTRIEADWESHKRSEALRNKRKEVQQLIDAGRPNDAFALVRELRSEDPDDDELKSLESKAQYSFDLNLLTKQVQQSLDRNDLEQAASQLSDSRERFGGDPVWQALQTETERRRAYETSLHFTEEWRRKGEYARAEELLMQLAEQHPLDNRGMLLLQAIKTERLAKEREQAIGRTRAEADRLMQKGEIARVITVLDQACRDFPDDAGLVQARAEAQRQAERDQAAHRQRIARHLDAIRQAIAVGDWPLAGAAVTAAQAEFPGDPAFEQLAEQVRGGQHQAGLELFVSQVEQSLDRKDLEGAARQLAGGRERFRNEAIWGKLQRDLDRRRAYESSLRRADDLRRQGQYQSAEELLRQMAGREPVDERAALLLQTVAGERTAKDRELTIERGRQEAEHLKQKGDLTAAIALLDRLSRQFPDDAGLVQARLDAERQAFDRRQSGRREKVALHLEAIRESLAARKWPEAIGAIQSAQQELPDEIAFAKFREQVRLGQYQEELELLAQQTQECLDHSDFEGAARLLAGSRDRFGQEKPWQALNRELERHRAYESGLARAEEWRLKEQYKKAEELLRQLAAQQPLDERAALLLRTIATERSIKEREKTSRKGVPKPALVRYRRLGAVAAVLLIGVVAVVSNRTRHPAFHAEPDPPRLSFTYRIGTAPPDPREIVLKNPGIPFSASASETWLVVTHPQSDRLQVSIRTTGLQAGPKDGTITIAPTNAAKVTGTPIVRVHLDVEAETMPPPPGPLPENSGQEILAIDPQELDFPAYQAGAELPSPQEIHVLRGRITSFWVDAEGSRWLKLQKKGTGIVVSVQPKDLPEGKHSSALTLKSPSGQKLMVPVALFVKATPPPVDKKGPPPPPPPPPAASKPCIPTEKWRGPLNGDLTWSGVLASGDQTLEPDGQPGRILGGGKFIGVCAKRIEVLTPQVEVTQVQNTNQWKVRNLSGHTLPGFRIHWSVE
jgi:serine/threonine-protein kinase